MSPGPGGLTPAAATVSASSWTVTSPEVLSVWSCWPQAPALPSTQTFTSSSKRSCAVTAPSSNGSVSVAGTASLRPAGSIVNSGPQRTAVLGSAVSLSTGRIETSVSAARAPAGMTRCTPSSADPACPTSSPPCGPIAA
jgi:hypothetical protein